MGFFDVFKKKNEPEMIKGVKNSIDEYSRKLEAYKKLRKPDVTSVPDEDLRTAVMSWMWAKFDEKWTNQYDVVAALPKACRDVYACCTVVDEINNGGINQLFFNATGQFAQMSEEGFRALGNDKLSEIMRSAIEIHTANQKKLGAYKDGTLESFSASYDEELFNDLDDAFSEEEPKIDDLLIAYIRSNESAFGD